MPRMRVLKPGFFQNEDLAEIDPLGRLLFQGLWTEADREGRLEDRPRRLKAAILPYDDCEVDKLLNDLQSRNFILRYEIESKRYIQITNFVKHQQPHYKEVQSIIPPPLNDQQPSIIQSSPDTEQDQPIIDTTIIQDQVNVESSSTQDQSDTDSSSVQPNRSLSYFNFNSNLESPNGDGARAGPSDLHRARDRLVKHLKERLGVKKLVGSNRQKIIVTGLLKEYAESELLDCFETLWNQRGRKSVDWVTVKSQMQQHKARHSTGNGKDPFAGAV